MAEPTTDPAVGRVINLGSSGRVKTFDDTLAMTGGKLGVVNPVQGVMSKAEFDALPEEEQNKGLYLISDGEGLGGGSGGVTPEGGRVTGRYEFATDPESFGIVINEEYGEVAGNPSVLFPFDDGVLVFGKFAGGESAEGEEAPDVSEEGSEEEDAEDVEETPLTRNTVDESEEEVDDPGSPDEEVAFRDMGIFISGTNAAPAGPVILRNVAAPMFSLDAANKKYVDDAVAGCFPTGGIIIWSGAANAVPTGWALCDGTNGTPDLRDRFVLGAGNNYAVGDTGGSEEFALTVGQMPIHDHHLLARAVMAEAHYDGASCIEVYAPDSTANNAPDPCTGPTGNSRPHPNMPPYYALCYIMKL